MITAYSSLKLIKFLDKQNLKFFVVILISFFLIQGASFPQEEIEMTQIQWESVRDSFAVKAIIMLARIDTMNIEIDSLKKLLDYGENLDCEAELYKIVDASKEQVDDFRGKFEATENKINNQIGTPGEARSFYLDEISSTRIWCLPEFSDRYLSMRKKFESWQSPQDVITVTQTEKTYTVIAGDHLRKIALELYGDADLWTLIWEANKEAVHNAWEISDPEKKKISNPDLIFPFQILSIPSRP